ncbi:MAG: dihydropyrimidine dehydrogenase [Robiginitomaculum sp.]|nr:MAG: dihydropyrimidine dehydrogenase [Robiginitomaculum sp.]
MTETMLKFTGIDGEMPAKRDAKIRAEDFGEIYADYIRAKAQEQSSRCSQCGVPFCQSGCPLQNNIPDWLYLSAEGRLEEAYQLSAQTNSMPEICGRICPQDRLCEGACVIEKSGHGSVTIGAIEKTLTDNAWEMGWVKPIKPITERALSVGIIGSGPAGLAAAEALREQGWQVSIYDRHDRAGGLLMYGIPNFKLDKKIVQRRIDHLTDGGVEFVLNTNIGTDISFDDLRKKHAAILVATGVYKSRELQVPGCGAGGVVEALPYLTGSNKLGLGDKIENVTAKDKHVVVIGGGDTAMDCVRTAIRQKAKSVTCLYRRDQANMPGSARETQNAMDEGVKFEWLAAPQSIHDKDSQVTKVRAVRMRLGLPDKSGRQIVTPIKGSEFDVKADMVIQALGFTPEDMGALNADMGLTDYGTIKTHPVKLETNIPGVYAAGDIVRGASLVVWAIREGRDAASAMHEYLNNQLAEIAAE